MPTPTPTSTSLMPTLNHNEISLIVHGNHWNPFEVLGLHLVPGGDVDRGARKSVVRAFLPEAKEAWTIDLRQPKKPVEVPMNRIDDQGLFEAVFDGIESSLPYRLRVENHEGFSWEFDDPYRFSPILTDFDLHLLGEGTHYRNFGKLGAHLREHEGVMGVEFAVWAPNALRVGVVGDFNRWDGRRHPMRSRGSSGVWELFIPGLVQGESYKYEIKSRVNNYVVQKSDPYGFHAELRPRTASKVWDVGKLQWNDQAWMSEREGRQSLESPISVYELQLGSWKKAEGREGGFLNYRQLADELVVHMRELNFTHVELMPINEYPFDGSWGYQPVGFFAPTSRFGTPDDFAYFVDTMHRNGFGVLLDWVPAHFPNDQHGLAFFDGTHLYEHEDPRLGEHRDWGTKIFNYGRPEVRNFLLGNALFWLETYHIDGLRVDAVASMLYLDYSREEGDWIPNIHGGNENLEAIGFIKRFNELCHSEHPGVITVAEESTSWTGVSRPTYLGGLGFSFKWNMGWMNDSLRYFAKDPIHRKYEHSALTFSMIYAFNENFMLPLSHDEVVHGKKSLLSKSPGDLWQKFANLRLLYAYMYGHPGKKLLFMGCEIAPWREWTQAESLDWHLLDWASHRGIFNLVRDLNALYRDDASLHQIDFDWRGFEWIELHDWENSVLSFMRRAKDGKDATIVICNFTPIPRFDYRIGVPESGFYREILNTDSEIYGGSNLGNQGGSWAHHEPYGGRPYQLTVKVPPLAVVFLKVPRDG